MLRTCFALMMAVVALLAARPAQSETLACTPIASLPATLTTQGVYCLDRDLSTALIEGSAITIAANNITLDCNGHALVGTAYLPATRANGIFAADRFNLTVRNCQVRGFYRGLSLDGVNGGGHLFEDNAFAHIAATGIRAQGDGMVIRRNTIHDVGGTNAGNKPTGMQLVGNSLQVLDNRVAGVVSSTLNVFGLYVSGNAPRVAGNEFLRLQSAVVWGMYLVEGEAPPLQAIVEGNVVMASGSNGLAGGSPQHLADPQGASLCRDNAYLGFDGSWLVPGSGAINDCIDGGGNVIR